MAVSKISIEPASNNQLRPQDKENTSITQDFNPNSNPNEHCIFFFTVHRINVIDKGVTFSPNHVLQNSKPG